MPNTNPGEVETNALDHFLEPAPPRRLQGPEALARLRNVFGTKLPLPPDEDLPQRIMVMWRLARAAARVLGICAEDESLDQATEVEPSPWTTPIEIKLSPSQQSIVRAKGAATFLAEIAGGIALLPVGDEATRKRWVNGMSYLAGDLNMTCTEHGERGLVGLLHYETCQFSGVTDEHIVAFEELLIDEAQSQVINCGERPTIDHFRMKYGLTRREAIGLIRLARSDALTSGASSVDEDRAIMVAQLKDLAARAKQEMNTERELRILKQLAAVQGLTRTEPENIAADFLKVVTAVAGRQDRVIEQKPLERLPEPREAQYIVMPPPAEPGEDDEDLEQFDAENRRQTH